MNPRLFDWLSAAAGIGDTHWQLIAQAAVPPGATVLDIGAGTGNLLLKVKRAVPDATVVGLDSDLASLTVAATKASRLAADVQLDHGDATHLSYPDATFDRVVSAFLLHHLPEDQRHRMLREVRRVLKPGGSLHLVDFTPGGKTRAFRPLSVDLSHRSHHDAHSEPHPDSGDTLALMQTELFDGSQVGKGTSRLGHHAFYRATR
ncbi:class I SAM-dependent methyltransferase [Mycolicibacterium hodleri]|uniref:class I SAM-dependent methyltransferase n=1 Tax=Mycolicibacterium hodleri TaxID=49897 RepID=UPI00137562AA|nr:class I SAM-dependent methyltransferase [Mycolicibacterium hodleri]